MKVTRRELRISATTLFVAAMVSAGGSLVRADEHDHHGHNEEKEHSADEACSEGSSCGGAKPAREDAHEGHEKDEHAHGEGKEHGEEKGHEHGEEEGHLELTPEMMKQVGLKVVESGPAKLNLTFTLTGKLVPHEDRVSHVTPRYPGVVREVRKRLGDAVARGETVAVVENNQTLQPYEVKSQIPGTVVRRHATLGESVTDASTLFDVADYSELFADFYVFPGDYSKVRLGQRVVIRVANERVGESAISFLSPVTDAETQSRFVRAVLPNPTAAYQAGMYVTGDVVLEESAVAVAVENSALRTSEGKTVVFVEEEPGHFEARPVVTGRRDTDSTEILKGLTAGTRYAAGNTFILQAELEKGEAEHSH